MGTSRRAMIGAAAVAPLGLLGVAGTASAADPTGQQVMTYLLLNKLWAIEGALNFRLDFDPSTPIPEETILGLVADIDALEPVGSREWTEAHRICDDLGVC